ncbi:MAG: PAS domain S-box protein, partial [Sphingobacteriales bacterium]
MPAQVWTSRPDGILDYVNQVVSNDFGKEGEQIVGEGWQAFIHPDDLTNCLNAWKEALQNGKEYLCEFRLLFKNGNYVWHLARALPLVQDGEIKMWLGTNTDIDLQKTNEQRKDEFISIASHELKTPLTSIKAFNQLMSKVDDPSTVKKFVSRSADSIERLEKLISDLLDVTKINAGKMSYNLASFDFNQMIHESIEAVQYTTTTHKIVLETEVDIFYTGDRFRLEQVMNNFLSNAIKYSPDADTILVNVLKKDNDLVVSVKDFGIGIAADKLDKIFDRYYRIDNMDMRFEGLGLGLFISSEILKRHNGSFWIESVHGEGATFSFRLPLKE